MKLQKRYVDNLAKAIEKEKAIIAASRDRLRDLLDDAEAVMTSSDEAVESLDLAVQKLSEYV